MEPMLAALPLAEYSMGWICFFAVGFAVGIVQMLVTGKKEQA
jgi:branched-subunit amino acid permease